MNSVPTGHLSMTLLTVLLAVGAGVLYGAFVLYGAWIDGRRQAVRDKGLHPVTDATGGVHAREQEKQDGSNRG